MPGVIWHFLMRGPDRISHISAKFLRGLMEIVYKEGGILCIRLGGSLARLGCLGGGGNRVDQGLRMQNQGAVNNGG